MTDMAVPGCTMLPVYALASHRLIKIAISPHPSFRRKPESSAYFGDPSLQVLDDQPSAVEKRLGRSPE
jgi:hypothetical protein